MKKLIFIPVLAIVLCGAIGTSQAFAAKPVVRACVGQSVSSAATAAPGYGHFVSGFAHADGGVGADLQALQAGLIPDGVFANTCNN